MKINCGLNRTGINIDCARLFCTETMLEQFIDDLAKNNGNYMQLHFSDNEAFNLENKYLGISTDNATNVFGTWYQKDTKKPFISLDQLQNIINYGRDRGIEVYPEIDIPAHSKSIYEYMKQTHPDLVKDAFGFPNKETNYYEIAYYNDTGLQVAKDIINEYLDLLPKGYHFAIGGDEVIIKKRHQDQNTSDNNTGDTLDRMEMINFCDALDNYITSYGLNTVMYNDSFYSQDYYRLWKNYYNHDILINYWSMSGSVEMGDSNDIFEQNIQQRESMSNLNNLGFKTINCNSDQVFVVANKWTFAKDRANQIYDHLKTWNPIYWFGYLSFLTSISPNNYGSAMTIWGESDEAGFDSSMTYDFAYPFVNKFFDRINQLKQLTKQNTTCQVSKVKQYEDSLLGGVDTNNIEVNSDDYHDYNVTPNDITSPEGFHLASDNQNLSGKIIWNREGPYLSNQFLTLYYVKNRPNSNLVSTTSYNDYRQSIFSINVQQGKPYWISFHVNSYDGNGGLWARSDWYPAQNPDGSWRDNDIDPNHYEAQPGTDFQLKFYAPKTGNMSLGFEGQGLQSYSISNLCITQSDDFVPFDTAQQNKQFNE